MPTFLIQNTADLDHGAICREADRRAAGSVEKHFPADERETPAAREWFAKVRRNAMQRILDEAARERSALIASRAVVRLTDTERRQITALESAASSQNIDLGGNREFDRLNGEASIIRDGAKRRAYAEAERLLSPALAAAE